MAHRVFTEELTFVDLVKDSFEIVKNNFKLLFLFTLVFQLPSIIYSSFNPFSEYSLAMDPSSILWIVILGLITIIGSIGAIKIIEDYLFEEKRSFGEYFNFSIKKFLPYIITTIVWAFTLMLSFALLIIPLFFVLTFTIFTIYIVVLRGIYNPFEAMKYSYNLVKNRALRTFGYSLAMIITLVIIMIILFLIPVGFNPEMITNPTNVAANPALNIVVTMIGILPSLFITTFIILMMINLEAEKGYYVTENEDNAEIN